MSKNEVKPETEKSYTEKTRLGGPILQIGGVKPLPCEVRLSSKLLAAAGLGPNYRVEMTARDGEITIRRLGGPARSIVNDLKTRRTPLMDELMDMTRELEARQRATREGGPKPAGADGLSEDQKSREEL